MIFSEKFVSASRKYCTFADHVPAPYIRRAFKVDGKAERAELTVTGLGFYELFLNGRRITKGFLSPYISNPDDLVFYDCYDLKPYLRKGENVIGLMLGNGMQNAFGGYIWDFDKARFRGVPRTAFCLELSENGVDRVIEADGQTLCHPSPVTFDDLRAGERFDARLIVPGWSEPGTDLSDWTPVLAAETPRGERRLCTAEPVGIISEITPVSVTPSKIAYFGRARNTPEMPPQEQPSAEGWLYDFGVNTSGTVRLRFAGEKGRKITLQFSEAYDKNAGGLDLSTMIFLPQEYNHRIEYICDGETHDYTPYFTYFGFRYCLVSGIDESEATPDILTCLEISSAFGETGNFECSDSTANSVFEICRRSDRSNFVWFPTDCPHREKNGWTGDAALSAERFAELYSCENSLALWLMNIRAAQREDGALPGIIPTGGWGFEWGNGPAWDVVLFWMPYYIWKYTGDTKIISDNAAAMLRYLHYVSHRRDSEGLVHIGLGDWCPTGRGADDYTSPLVFSDTVICCDIFAKAAFMFGLIGDTAEKTYAEELHAEFLAAARSHLIDSESCTALGNSQTSQSMALYFDIFTEEQKPRAFERLVEMIENNNRKIDGGTLCFRTVFHILERYGRADLAYEAAMTHDFPSYGWWLSQGATSCFETFRILKAGEHPASMNHHFFGDIASWLVRAVAGVKVNPNDEGALTAEISPCFIKKLNYANGSCRGLSCEWRRENKAIIMKIRGSQKFSGEILLRKGASCNGKTHLPLADGDYTVTEGNI